MESVGHLNILKNRELYKQALPLADCLYLAEHKVKDTCSFISFLIVIVVL